VTTDLLVILIFGACLAGWVLLALVGAERQRMISEIDAARVRSQPEPAAAPTAAVKAPPGRTAAKARPPTKPTKSAAPNAR
jgi:hypothetical protein